MSKRPRPGPTGLEVAQPRFSSDPGRIHTDPRVFEPHAFDEYDQLTVRTQQGPAERDKGKEKTSTTDFTSWTEDELRSFLDRRGEDYDTATDKTALILAAERCEAATGPAVKPSVATDVTTSDEAIDPLDAFMAEINEMEKAQNPQAQEPSHKPKGRFHDEDEYDPAADYVQARQEGKLPAGGASAWASVNTGAGDGAGSDDEVYAVASAVDAARNDDGSSGETKDGHPGGKFAVGPLPPLDHSKIQYEEFGRDFYDESADIQVITPAEVAARRRDLGIRVSGFDSPKPVASFDDCGLDPELLALLAKIGFKVPSAIQAQALPAALSGRDVLGIAKTGSGKTAAFLIPAIVHVMGQREVEKGEGPIAVIVAPTHELAEQIHREAYRFGKVYGLRTCAVFGGLSKHQQFKELRAGVEILVCTPGRLIDLIKAKACNMQRVTYLVFDEADRMFDLGFEPQVRSILGQIRPDRQLLIFSATITGKVERLASDALSSPIRITVGQPGAANEDISQRVEVVASEAEKKAWMSRHLPVFVDAGEVLVFAGTRIKVEELAEELASQGFRAGAIHGDLDPSSRAQVLQAFRAGSVHVLVATDVAARGLDIKQLHTVINYDVGKSIESYIHRIGRTGRAGDKEGVAYALLLPTETAMAGELVGCLQAAGQPVPAELRQVAECDPRYRRQGKKRGWKKARVSRAGASGLGFGSRPPPPATSAEAAAATSRGIGPSSGWHPPQPQAPSGFTPATQVGNAPPQPVITTAAPLSQGVGWQARQSAAASHFHGSFVSSGRQHGPSTTGPQIVLPKSSNQRPLPPPPMPVTAQARPRPQPAVVDPLAMQTAAERARAIAARLTAGGQEAGGASAMPPMPASRLPALAVAHPPPAFERSSNAGTPGSQIAVQDAMERARAIAARLSRQDDQDHNNWQWGRG